MNSIKQFYKQYLQNNKIRYSAQRDKILDVFLNMERHLSIAQIYELVRNKYSHIGYATVYRAMNLICKAGIAEKIDLGDGISRFEHKYGQEHHDHLICVNCGKFIEVIDTQIEELQRQLAKAHKFVLKRHKMQLFGSCCDCVKAAKQSLSVLAKDKQD
ncbi:MAG: transcriptional repressor [Candidatus Omnitrophica bacterium]|nr:transcriptional repressor [Candidatus Omnitrophota bacterium]